MSVARVSANPAVAGSAPTTLIDHINANARAFIQYAAELWPMERGAAQVAPALAQAV
jgi:hypothetical protein